MSEERETRNEDAAAVASGSGALAMGGVSARGIRLVLLWVLQRWLGATGVGLYAFAVTVTSIVTAFSPMGLDSGVVYFGSRFRAGEQRDRLKGLILFGLILTLGSGLAGAGLLWFAPTWAPLLAGWIPWIGIDDAEAGVLRQVSPVVAIWSPLLFANGAVRAARDMRASAIAYQVVLPGAMLVGSVVALLLGAELPGVIAAYTLAHVISLLWSWRSIWRHYGALLADRALRPAFDWGRILRYSLPQSLNSAMDRMNQWMDILMLAAMASAAEVGTYRVASALAAMGSIPVMAITNTFNPVIAELVLTKEYRRLDALLKTVTRWLVILNMPLYLVLMLLPEVVLGTFTAEFREASLGPLQWLLLGQAITVACAPAMRVIPMSGHALLNTLNGIVATGLNVGLNLWLIPRYGGVGAAIATSASLSAWSLWRVVEVYWLTRCWPFSWRTGGLLALILGCGGGLYWLDLGFLPRLGGVVICLLIFYGGVWLFGRTEADALVVDRLKGKLGRLAKRLGR